MIGHFRLDQTGYRPKPGGASLTSWRIHIPPVVQRSGSRPGCSASGQSRLWKSICLHYTKHKTNMVATLKFILVTGTTYGAVRLQTNDRINLSDGPSAKLTTFLTDPHVHKSMWCKVCDAECDLMRGVDGPTGFHYNGSEPHRTAHAPCYTCPAINRVRNKA